jgi:hypothetical protein
MQNTPSTKKIVHYDRNKEVFIQVGHSAFVTPIDHPDSERVTNTYTAQTSRVVNYDEATGEFETMNTLYKPASVN